MQSFKHHIISKGTYLAFVDGQQCAVMAHFYEEIAMALNFPPYFRHNFDSLDECLNDLSWIGEKEINLIIFHYEDLLFEEPHHLEVVKNIFANAIGELEEQGKHFSIYTQRL